MSLRMRTVVIDTPNPTELVDFWAGALDREIVETGHDEFILLRDRGGRDPKMLIQKVDGPHPGGKNRVHFDLYASDPAVEAARLERSGAKVIETFDSAGDMWIWMKDPHGNDFCIVRSSDG